MTCFDSLQSQPTCRIAKSLSKSALFFITLDRFRVMWNRKSAIINTSHTQCYDGNQLISDSGLGELHMLFSLLMFTFFKMLPCSFVNGYSRFPPTTVCSCVHHTFWVSHHHERVPILKASPKCYDIGHISFFDSYMSALFSSCGPHTETCTMLTSQ